MAATLTHWTNRVADMKFRELEVSSRFDKSVMRSASYVSFTATAPRLRTIRYSILTSIQLALSTAFKKWKSVCIRHVEELSLMESYQDVKREGQWILRLYPALRESEFDFQSLIL